MKRRAFLAAAALALTGGCVNPIVRADRHASLDSGLDLVVIVRVGPGKRERQHEIFVGIGDRGDNPAIKYLHEEYTYLLAGELDWRVNWQSNERVTLELLERLDPGAKGAAAEVRTLIVLTFVRDAASGKFRQLLQFEETQREIA